MDNYKDFELKKNRLLEEFNSINGPVSLGKDTSNLFRHRQNSKSKRINVKNFNQVLSVDKKRMLVDVEGMTTYEALVEETLKFNVMPCVVPELKSITIGGALTGIGIEASSFKYGLVHETIEEMEILLSDGQVVVATRDNQYSDLFHGFPNSYGTLGYVIRLKARVVPVKKYVKINHIKFSDSKKYFAEIERLCNKYRHSKNIGFIDGSIFSESEMYITIGEFSDKAPANKVSDYTYMQIYYKSIKEKKEDYLTIKDFIWRWDTDWFWCSEHFGVENKFIRFLFGKKRLRSTTYWKIREFFGKIKIIDKFEQAFSKRKESVVQDVEIPIDNAGEFLDFFQKEIGITPVWMCPTRAFDRNARYPLYEMDKKKLYINFGFWNIVSTNHPDGYFNKKIESIVQRLGGKKSLYSTSYYTPETFWKLYNKNEYFSLKKKYDSSGRLKNLYDKCVKRG